MFERVSFLHFYPSETIQFITFQIYLPGFYSSLNEDIWLYLDSTKQT